MRRLEVRASLLCLAIVLAASAATRADHPNAIVGEWDMRTKLGTRTIEAIMKLFLDDRDELAGTWTSRGLEVPLADVSFEDGTLRFTRTVGEQVLTFDGVVVDHEITGVFSSALGELSVTGGRRPEREPPRPAIGGGPTLLDGREQTFIVVGDSTSYAWPAILQDMLDEHAGGQRLYHVQNAVVGGSPVDRWIREPGDPYYEATFGAMQRDFFGEEAALRPNGQPEATMALCQQSLQRTRSSRGPVRTSNDAEGIRIGADALEKLSFQLRELGVERVVIGMHIYKEPVEPEVGNERFALKALLARGHDFVHEGPDVWSLTIDRHPDAFDEDGVHPNELGMKIMAAAWYRTLAGSDARDEIVDDMFDRSYDITEMMRHYLAWRAGHADGPPVTIEKSP